MNQLVYSKDETANPILQTYWQSVLDATFAPESVIVAEYRDMLSQTHTHDVVLQRATPWVEQLRSHAADTQTLLEQLIQEYQLSTHEGIILMSLAESLIRIPDADLANELLWSKLAEGNWEQHLMHSDSVLVNTVSRCLYWSQKMVLERLPAEHVWRQSISDFVLRQGQHLIRKLVNQAIQLIARQFVKGETIEQAFHHSKTEIQQGYHFSYDMLGEAALTEAEAERYCFSYLHALEALAQRNSAHPVALDDQLSIKLSALSPRYEASQPEALERLLQRLLRIVLQAKSYNIAVSIDAEESYRQELGLRLLERLLQHPQLVGWGGVGIAVQAYSKRSFAILGWLGQLSQLLQTRIPVRLVKGAYWDSEVKLAQQKVLPDYPVFTHKRHTDLSYYACAQFLLQNSLAELLYPQFATHNAYSIAWLVQCAQVSGKPYELQRLHGMGDALYQQIKAELNVDCRIYAPVGHYKALLPYLVRRLLENSANSSFVTHLYDQQCQVTQLLPDPMRLLNGQDSCLPSPARCFNTHPRACGNSLDYAYLRQQAYRAIHGWQTARWQAYSLIDGVAQYAATVQVVNNPANPDHQLGDIHWLPEKALPAVLAAAQRATLEWRLTTPSQRQQWVQQFALLLEQNRDELCALCQFEAGKTLSDAVDDLREAIEFCHYYCQQLDQLQPKQMCSVTGEDNQLRYRGKGIVLCISPWNFPIAIFVGQIVAALLTGNVVIAKPAPQTNLLAFRLISLLHEAGIPVTALQLALVKEPALLEQLTTSASVNTVLFTGALATAKHILQAQARLHPGLPELICETSGQNVMVADSSALIDQLVPDVVQSAFLAAGQRCSCLRLLLIQRCMLKSFLQLLSERLDCLTIGDPSQNETDIGPVIDQAAQQRLNAYLTHHQQQIVYQYPAQRLPDAGFFVAPTIIQLTELAQLGDEQFGPILHILPFEYTDIDDYIHAINQLGYGLTFGIHSRNVRLIERLTERIQAGNVYVNRHMVGAVVGSQPFGGIGLSGRGFKAGGPHYLLQLLDQIHICQNTAAMGGNYQLLQSDLF